MTTKTLPYIGEYDVPGLPGKLQVARSTFGLTTDVDVQLLSSDHQNSDGTYPVFTVPANTYVHSVGVWITTALTSGSMHIGDGTDSDGWLSDTLLDPTATTAGITRNSMSVASGFRNGKIYTSEDTIDIDLASTTPGAGAGEIYILYALNVGAD